MDENVAFMSTNHAELNEKLRLSYSCTLEYDIAHVLHPVLRPVMNNNPLFLFSGSKGNWWNLIWLLVKQLGFVTETVKIGH